jgi:anti-sigma28 factor (negative regulator of flagellin synthesis)
MAVAEVTKGPHLHRDDATLESCMDHRDNPSTRDKPSADNRSAHDPRAANLPVIDDRIDKGRLKKIARLKQAVADGTYRVSAEDLADKLIAHMLEPKG